MSDQTTQPQQKTKDPVQNTGQVNQNVLILGSGERINSKKYLWFYVPLVTAILSFISLQIWVYSSCTPTPITENCTLGWYNLIIVPVFLVAFFISVIVALIGTVKLIQFKKRKSLDLK